MKRAILLFIMSVLALTIMGCESEEALVLPADPSQPTAIHLVTRKQRVREFNCFYQVISDRVLTISLPEKTLAIHPENGRATSEILKSYFYNKTTGGENRSFTGSSRFKISLTSDSNLRVTEGLNEIIFEFEFRDGKKETGSRFIEVTHEKINLDGILDQYPSPSDCQMGGVK